MRATGGAVIPNCLVEISGETSVAPSWNSEIRYFSHEATTDATGRYVLTDVVQGSYSLRVNQRTDPPGPRHLPGFGEAAPWWGDLGDPANTLHLVTGGTTVNVPDIVLPGTAAIRGRAMDDGQPIEGADVFASVTAGDVTMDRWLSTGADGRYTIPDAMAGDWTITISGKDREIPVGATPGGPTSNGAVTLSPPDTFAVAAGDDVTRPDTEFDLGQRLNVYVVEYHAPSSSSFNLPDMSLTLEAPGEPIPGTDMTSEPLTYWFRTGDNGLASVYLPGGGYHLTLSDDAGAYDAKSLPDTITLAASPAARTLSVEMVPALGTYAVWGHITEAGTGNQAACWITASKVVPGQTWTEWHKRVPSNGSGNSLFMIRLPQDTGYTGNQVKLDIADQFTPPGTPTHVTKTLTVAGPSDMNTNPTLTVGGTISGTVHDADGDPVPGCSVSAGRRAFNADIGAIAWGGSDGWWTRTDVDGNYSIGGLVADSNYKVNYYADYNPGELLPIKYKDYYRRTYKGQPTVDSLNDSATPIGGVVDHTSVPVTLGNVTPGIDETITLGGYVALHADGPAHPTGSVWCDVMYNYKGQWFEIDSGYTTGGTFQKLWKVLPTGSYRLTYSDYFGRGSGTWNFTLGAGEHKFASVMVPAPVEIGPGVSGSAGGTFAGVLGGGSGLEGGGTGGVSLDMTPGAVPPGAPPLPTGYIPVSTGVIDVSLASGEAAGTWTLTLPYDPAVPDSDVPYLRVIHYKQDGTSETLSPIAWNTLNHTIMVQTSSLSPFRVVYKKHKVSVGTPVASSTWRRTRTYTVYASLSPRHTSGIRSARFMVYKKNSRGRYVWYKNVSTTNYNYKTISRFKARLKLRSGRYRIYSYAYSDKWHLATKSSRYKSVLVR